MVTRQTRRRVLGALSAALLFASPAAEAANRLNTAKAGRPGAGGGGSFLVNASGYGDSNNTAYPPHALSTKVCRSLTAGKLKSRVMLQEECAWPHSAPATSWTISGANVSYFEQGTVAGSVELTSAALALLSYGTTLTIIATGHNAAGDGVSSTITYYIPALADEFFVDIAAANQAGTGTYASPYKYMPQTADYTGSAKTFGPGQVVFFATGAHRTALMADKSFANTFTSHMTHAGSTGSPVDLELNGLGGFAQILGDDLITSATTVTSGQVGGSPDYTNIRRYDMSTNGGALEPFAGVYDGDALTANSKLYRSQFPLPTNPARASQFDPYVSLGSEKFGMRGLPASKVGTTCMYTSHADGVSAGTTVTIKDPTLATRYASQTAAFLNTVMIGTAGNHTAEYSLASFDNVNGVIVINSTDALTSINSKVFYAIINCSRDIVQAGQYAISADGLTLDVHGTNGGNISVTRRFAGVEWGMGGYIRFHGGVVARFGMGQSRSSGYKVGGAAFHFYRSSSAFRNECDVVATQIKQCHADDAALFYISGGTYNTTGVRDSNIELCDISECEARLLANNMRFDGDLTSTTRAGRDAYPKGKIQYNRVQAYGLNSTVILSFGGRGYQVKGNNIRSIKTLHSDIFAMYEQATPNLAGQQNDYFDIVLNEIIDCSRFTTTDGVNASRHATIQDNFVLISKDDDTGFRNPGAYDFGGEQGGEWARNLIMAYDVTDTYYIGLYLNFNAAGISVHNNVLLNIFLPSGWTGSVTDNYFTAEFQGSNNLGSGGTVANNTQLTAGSQIFGFASVTVGMAAKLGAGALGNFRTV